MSPLSRARRRAWFAWGLVAVSLGALVVAGFAMDRLSMWQGVAMGFVPMLALFLGIGMGIGASFEVGRQARRGEGVIARWSFSPAQWRAHHVPRAPMGMPAADAGVAVDVVLTQHTVYVGDDYVAALGLPQFVDVQLRDGRWLDFNGGSDEGFAVPVAPGAEALADDVVRWFAARRAC
jgi:hypothetical protein